MGLLRTLSTPVLDFCSWTILKEFGENTNKKEASFPFLSLDPRLFIVIIVLIIVFVLIVIQIIYFHSPLSSTTAP